MDFTKSKIAIAVATAATLTGCGGGGGGPQTRPSPIIEWGNGVYDPWLLTSSTDTTVNDTTEVDCRNDNYERNVWWEKIIDGVRTGIKGDLIRVETKTEEVCVNTTVSRYEDVETSESTVTRGTTTVETTYTDTTSVTTDVSGNTVTEVWRTYTDTTTTPVTTTTVTTTTRTTYYSNGTSSSEVIDSQTTQETSNDVTSSAREAELVSRTVTANLISSTLSSVDETTTTNGTPTSVTTYTDETRTLEDANGSTVTEVWRVYTTTVTTPVTTTVTTTVTRIDTYSDGRTIPETVSVTPVSSTANTTSTSTTEELLSSTTTPNVVSTSTSSADSVTTSTGTATTETTYVDDVRTSLDANGSTITETWRVYTDTTTTPVTTTTVTTITRTTVYTDGTSVTEPVSVTSADSTENTVTTSTREELQSRTVTPNVASTADSSSDVTSTSTGTATVTTTYVDDVRTSLDANGSTVTETWRVHTDTTTTPVTTTVTTTTTRTTTYTDSSTTSEVIDVSSTESVSNTVTTATREELLSSVTTPNVAGTSDSTSSSTTTTVSDPVFDRTVTNTDTRPDGVWTYYYDYWITTTTAVTTVTTTRTTTYTNGTTNSEVIDVTTTENVTTAETYTTRIVAPEATPADPSAPESNAGTVITQDNAPTLDYDPATYNYLTYYNSNYVGTPTAVDSNDPADFATVEADNGAVLDVNANYAYARGWTGKGSTVMIMDSGIDQDHPEFEGKIKYLWDAGYDTPYEDTNGHGTHVAGIVAANKNDTGMHGIAYDADLAIARITDTGYGNYYAIAALDWAKQYEDIVAANLSSNTVYPSSYRNAMTYQGDGVYTNSDATYGGVNYYNLENPATWAAAMPSELVLTVSAGNQSLGYVQNPATFATAVDADGNLLFDRRMLVVGNWNTSTQSVDGAKSGHVCKDYTVTCNDPYLTKDFYILAPGSQINSTYLNGEYKSMSGTSMAAPVVAGAVAIVHQLWPYMKGSNIAQLLLQTANKTITGYDENTHGQGLLDLDQATRPVGDLGISLTGRTGSAVQISGSISVNGVNDAVLSNISAVDDFDRDFVVDLSGAKVDRKISVEYAERQKDNNSWAASMSNISTRKSESVRFGASENAKNFAIGYDHKIFDTNATVGVSYTKSDSNPWIDMSGMWGEVKGARTTELNLTYDFSDNAWVQAGAMDTRTDFSSGLVTDVSNVRSVYAVAGYDADNYSVYAGIKPYAVDGSVTMRLPTSVDTAGVMHYDTVSSNIRSTVEGYAGFKHNYTKDNHSTTFVGVVDSDGDKHLGFNYRYKF